MSEEAFLQTKIESITFIRVIECSVLYNENKSYIYIPTGAIQLHQNTNQRKLLHIE